MEFNNRIYSLISEIPKEYQEEAISLFERRKLDELIEFVKVHTAHLKSRVNLTKEDLDHISAMELIAYEIDYYKMRSGLDECDNVNNSEEYEEYH